MKKRIGGGLQCGFTGSNVYHRGERIGDVLALDRKRKPEGDDNDGRKLH
jgi:hypothetical protein